MKFTISLDFEKFKHKPSSKLQYKDQKDKFGNPRSEVSVIGSRLGSKIETVSTAQLAKAISNGQTWSPFIFKECPNWKRRRRLEGLFESTQSFALDFDNGESIEEIKSLCKSLALYPNIIHTSFSSTPDLVKFRIIFITDKIVSDFSKVRKYNLGLVQAFNSDKACIDAARLYFGSTSESIIFHQADTFNTLDSLEALSKHISTSNYIKKCEPKEIDWGDSTTQQEIFNRLPRKKLNLVKSKIQTYLYLLRYYDGSDGGSRYNTVWKSTSSIARMPEVTGKSCYEWVTQMINKNPYFDDWDYDLNSVVTSAIEWSFNHADDPV